MAYMICWLLAINRDTFFLPKHIEHMFIFVFFPKSDERHKFELFYQCVTILGDNFQMDYH